MLSFLSQYEYSNHDHVLNYCEYTYNIFNQWGLFCAKKSLIQATKKHAKQIEIGCTRGKPYKLDSRISRIVIIIDYIINNIIHIIRDV